MIGSIIPQDDVIIGTLRSENHLSGIMRSTGTLVGSLSRVTGYDDYQGSYEVTPDVTSQTMTTEDKHMVSNVIVQAIPYYEVSNLQGGSTIIIGGNT